MSGVHRDTAAEAAKRDAAIVWPRLDELFIDIDSPAALERFRERFALLEKSLGQPLAFDARPSRTPGHWHVVVMMHRPLKSEIERVCLQSILGSDPNRELFSWVRHELDQRPVSCFFEPPEFVGPVDQVAAVEVPPLTFEATAGYGHPGYR